MSNNCIAFTGDITFTKYFSNVEDIEKLLDVTVAYFLRDADYIVGNIEGAITRSKRELNYEFKHHSDTRFSSLIRDIGINIWNLANNHALDFGRTGIEDTLRCATEVGCEAVGISLDENVKPYIISSAGGIGLLSVTYSEKHMKQADCSYIDWDDYKKISEHIVEIKRKNRWCVIIAHGGSEFSDMPTPQTREKYRKYLELGADIVVGHHSHTVQNYEKVGDKIIFYSLGNFIFDTDYQRAQLHTEIGEILQIRFTEEAYEWKSCPILINRDEQKIYAYEDPVVFIDLNDNEYKKLWPYAAIGLSKAERNVVSYLNPDKYKNFTKTKWIARDIKGMKNQERRAMIIGKYIAYMKRIVGRDVSQEIKRYISHQ